MKPLFVLLAVFGLAALILKISTGHFDIINAGNIAMGVMLVFTALGHFKFMKGMTMMMPAFVPYKKMLVIVTGVFEIVAGIALFFASIRYTTGIILVLFFALMLPANINAAILRVNHETAAYDGPGLAYLWFRIPLQVLFGGWAWYFSICNSHT